MNRSSRHSTRLPPVVKRRSGPFASVHGAVPALIRPEARTSVLRSRVPCWVTASGFCPCRRIGAVK